MPQNLKSRAANPGGEMEAEDRAILRVLSFTLEHAARQNMLVARRDFQMTRFHALSIPKISRLKYLQFIWDKSRCDRSCFVIAMIFLDRVMGYDSNVQVTPYTVHKLVLCALLTAAKFNTDAVCDNLFWAGIGGTKIEELNQLELEFLFLIHFSLMITEEEFVRYNEELKNKAALPDFVHPCY
jgi:plasmid stability protein